MTKKLILGILLFFTMVISFSTNIKAFETYDVHFNTNGGTAISSVSVLEGFVVGNVADPTKSGYTFAGWYSDYQLTTSWDVLSDPVMFEMILYAKWTANIYTITGTIDGVPHYYDFAYGENIDIPDPVKTGYTFNHWVYQGLSTIFNETTMPNYDLSITAVFTINTYTFTTTVNNITTSTNYYYGDTLILSDPVKTGHTFSHWLYSGTNTTFNLTTMPDNNVHIIPVFIPNIYTITTVIDGVPTDHNFAYGTAINIPDPVKTGYTFLHWEYQGLTTVFNLTTMPDYNLTIYPVFTLNIHTFTVIVEGVSNDYTYEYGETLILSDPVKTGYTFINWVYTGTSDIFNLTTMPDNDISITAVFTTVLNTHTLTAYIDGVPTAYTYEYGETIVLPDPYIEGFVFSHWIWQGTNNVFIDTTMPDYNVNITAHFGVTLTVIVDGVSTDYGYDYGDNLNIPIPTKENFVFSHWVYYVDNTMFTATTMPNNSVTIVAIWSVIVWFSSEGEILDYLTQVATVGNLISPPPEPIRQGYTFMGWYTTPSLITKWNFDTNIAPNNTITLYAKWSQNVDVSIYDFFEDTGLNTPFGKVLFSVGFILFIVVVLALFSLNKMMVMIIGVGLLLGFIALGFIPVWITILLTIIAFSLLILTIKGGSSNV